MYETHYGLSANPFRLAPDPSFFYESACHKRGLAYLRYGLHQGQGFVVITGIPGTGKSLLVQTIFAELSGQRMVVSSINNTNLEADDTLRAVANSFDVYCNDSTKAALLNALERFLLEKHRQGKRVLLIVDEAQNLPLRSLEELRMLSNFQRGDQQLIQIMLVGQQQLQHNLANPKLEQLAQRVIASCHLRPLEPVETRGYIEYRLRHVGWRGKPSFTGEALGLIHQATQGIPRVINSFCDRLLLAAYLEEKEQIDATHLQAVLHELQNEVTGLWQGINLKAVPSLSLPPLPDGKPLLENSKEKSVKDEVINENKNANEKRDEKSAPSSAITHEKKRVEPKPARASAEPFKAFKSKLHTSGVTTPVNNLFQPATGGGLAASGRQAPALSPHSRNEHVAPKAQSIAPSSSKQMANAMTGSVVDSRVIPLSAIQLPAFVNRIADTIVAWRWWFAVGIVVMIVMLLLYTLGANGSKIGQNDPSSPLHQGQSNVKQTKQLSLAFGNAVVVDNAAITAKSQVYEPNNLPLGDSITSPVDEGMAVAINDRPEQMVAPRIPGVVAEPHREEMKQSKTVVAATAKSSISEVELPVLIDNYLFAYESGDIDRFVGLFAADAVVDENTGLNKIGRDYGALFQATEMRRMNIGAIKWRQVGSRAQGTGDFELTVRRRGDKSPSIIKGQLDIEVAKEEDGLLIHKLTHMVSR